MALEKHETKIYVPGLGEIGFNPETPSNLNQTVGIVIYPQDPIGPFHELSSFGGKGSKDSRAPDKFQLPPFYRGALKKLAASIFYELHRNGQLTYTVRGDGMIYVLLEEVPFDTSKRSDEATLLRIARALR